MYATRPFIWILFFIFLLVFRSDVTATHAAGMDIYYECISPGTPGIPTTTLIGNGNVSVNIETNIWALEISWTITNSSGSIVAQGGARWAIFKWKFLY